MERLSSRGRDILAVCASRRRAAQETAAVARGGEGVCMCIRAPRSHSYSRLLAANNNTGRCYYGSLLIFTAEEPSRRDFKRATGGGGERRRWRARARDIRERSKKPPGSCFFFFFLREKSAIIARGPSTSRAYRVASLQRPVHSLFFPFHSQLLPSFNRTYVCANVNTQQSALNDPARAMRIIRIKMQNPLL